MLSTVFFFVLLVKDGKISTESEPQKKNVLECDVAHLREESVYKAGQVHSEVSSLCSNRQISVVVKRYFDFRSPLLTLLSVKCEDDFSLPIESNFLHVRMQLSGSI